MQHICNVYRSVSAVGYVGEAEEHGGRAGARGSVNGELDGLGDLELRSSDSRR